jgi:hypothetical protein
MMWNEIIRNWKTSVAGLIFALGVLLKVMFPAKGEIIDKAADVFLALGPILGLLFAKDGGNSGTAANPNP